MTPSRIAYTVAAPQGRATLCILLESGHAMPPAEMLKAFHHATGGWEKTHRGMAVRSELDAETMPDETRMTATDYLYADNTFNSARFHRHLSMLAEHGSVHRFIPHPGVPVEGRDLWGREEERRQLRTAIRDTSCHVQGPRRYGKTSLLRSLDQSLTEDGQPSVMADVSSNTTPVEFFATLATAAMDRPLVRPALAKAVPELAGWPAQGSASNADDRSTARVRLMTAVARDPIRFGKGLLAGMASIGTVLMIDEFSLFLRCSLQAGNGATLDLLGALRKSRAAGTGLRQVVAGSAGLTSFARFHGMADDLDDLEPIPVRPLDTPAALALAEELIYGAGLRPARGMAQAVLDEVGLPVPYFIQALCDAARAQAAARMMVDEATVRDAYREHLLGPPGNHLFRVYRLDHQPYPDDLRRTAGQLLMAMAECPAGVPRPKLESICRQTAGDTKNLDSLLACLSEDYDLEERSSRWRFRSKVLRERWRMFGQS